MNKDEFKKILEEDKKIIDRAFEEKFNDENPLNESLKYATNSGKRIRPIIFLETYRMLNGSKIDKDIIDFATSLEMIHAYSLIHDDLPVMDNDDYRRGKLTLHKKFGEDIAILAGDSLLSLAFENAMCLAKRDQRFLDASLYLARACGKDGMIKGQVFDIRAGKTEDLSYILDVYKNKTSRLFMAATTMAALLSDLEVEKVNALEEYAYYLGLAFQLEDDVIDEYDEKELNILSVLPIERAKNMLLDFNSKAREKISLFKNNDFHLYLIDYLTERTK